MGLADDIINGTYRKKKKKTTETTVNKTSSNSQSNKKSIADSIIDRTYRKEDYFPSSKKDKEDKKMPWYKTLLKGSLSIAADTGVTKKSEAFDDGYQFGDISKTIGGTITDTAMGVGKGIIGLGENIGDGISAGIAQVADWTGNDEYAENVRSNIANKKGHVITDTISKGQETIDSHSVIGDTGDMATEGIGQALGIWALGGVGGKAAGLTSKGLTTTQQAARVAKATNAVRSAATFASAAGGTFSETYQNEDVEDWQAWAKALGTGYISQKIEKIGGLFSVGGADKVATNTLTKNMESAFWKSAVRNLGTGIAEGGEEAAEYIMGRVLDLGIDTANTLTTNNDTRFLKEWDWDEFWNNMFVGAMSGTTLGGGQTVSSTVDAKISNPDMTWKQAFNEAVKQQDIQSQTEVLDEKKASLEKELTSKKLDEADINEIFNEMQEIENKRKELVNSANIVENNQEPLYNNNESESGINGNIEGYIDEGRNRLYEKQENNQNREYSWEEYNKWEQSIKPIEEQNLAENERQLIKNAKSENNKDVILYDENSNDNTYSGGASQNVKNKIVISKQKAEIFGLRKMIDHETAESDILHDEIANDILTPIIEAIESDTKFDKQKDLFWEGQEGNIPSNKLIAKDILCDRFSELKNGEKLDYENVLSNATNSTIDMALKNYYKQVYGKELGKTSSFYNESQIKLPPPVQQNTQQKVIAPLTKNQAKYNKYKQNIIKSKENQVNNLISFKNETSRNIDQKIAEKEVLLNSKKNQNTKTASILKSQIENLKAQKQNIENLYNEKIDKTNSKINKEKIEFETRNRMKKEAREVIKAEIAPLTEDLTKYKDKKAGWKYNRETAQRNIDDIVSDEDLAGAIKEIVFNPVQKHQAEKTREINTIFDKINSLNLDKRKKYHYVPKESIVGLKVDEATLAQLLIEKKITDNDLLKYDISKEGIEKIHNTANTFKEILEDLYIRMNEQQLKYGYSPIGKIENYFPHFTENKADTMLGKIASYFNIDLSNQNLPTNIAGLTDTFKPGETWNANIQKRRTEKTDYDALTAMERYVLGATEIIHTTEDIQRIREYSKQIRYKYSDKAIQEEIDNIVNDNKLTQEAKDSSLEGIFDNLKNGLPNFVTWLDDYANSLAGKKAFSDRGMERNIGRNIYTSMTGIESRIASNTIGGNVSVSLTNFAPLFQAMGTTKVNYLLTGMLQTTKNNITGMFDGGKDTTFASNSTFLTNRFGTDSIARKTFSQKVSDKASALMNTIDEFTAESIVRGKYLENLDNGMTEEQALKSADEYAGKLMADRSKGALPLIFNSKNPLSKLMTMFQVEPNNIVSNYFKDMPRDAKNNAQYTKQITKLMIASYAFNTLVMAIRGGNEVLPDPIRWVSYLIKMATGDDDEKEKAKTDLIESIAGNIPFASNLAGLLGFEDIGRVPISNAMPDLTKISSLFDPEVDSQYKKETALKEFSKPFLYLGLPTGGAQIKKSVEGIATVSSGGSYKTNKEGEKQLQFAVENPNALDYIKAGLLGKYSLNDSKVYADRGYKALSAKQTKTYEQSKIPYKEYIEYLDQKLTKKEDKIEYLNSQNWSTNQKWGIYKNEILSNTKREDGGSQLSDAEYIIKNGTSKAEYIDLYNKAQQNNIDMPTKEEYIEIKENGVSLKGYIDYKTKIKEELNKKRQSGELTEKQDLKDKDKIEILLNSNYSQEEIQGIYESYILSSTDKKYPLIKNTGIDINEYLKYKSQEFTADKKDDGTVDGQSISGSKKQKVKSYIENMDITYTQKLVLYGLEYTPSDSDKTKIVNYVKNIPDKTNKEKLEMLDQFEWVTIYKNGGFKY